MSISNDQKMADYRSIRLIGKKTKKVRYLIVIDEDEEGQNQLKFSKSSFKKDFGVTQERHLKIEQQVQQRMVAVSQKKTAASKQWFTRCDQSQIIQITPPRPARKTVKPPSSVLPNRPKTRSSICLSQRSYSDKNYAKIPQILDPKSTQYKKLLITKCVSLANREYIVLN